MNFKAAGILLLLCAGLPALYSTFAGACGAVFFGVLLTYVVSSSRTPTGLRPKRPKRALLHDKFSEDKLPDKVDAVVVGSGLGGLTAAALLARSGKKVVVLEQHPDVCGGSTHQFNLQGYNFDSGLHYTVPWNGPLLQLTALKKQAEVPAFEMLGEPGKTTFDYVYMGDKPVFEVKHKEEHLAEIFAMFPKETDAIKEFLKVSEYSIHMTQVVIVSRLLPEWLKPLYWKLVPQKWIAPQLETAVEVLDKLTDNVELKSLLCSLWLDSGGRPDKATFMMTAAVIRGLPREGGCYPRGGSKTLAETLVPIVEEWGGRVLIDARVGQINIGDNGAANGVTLADGTVIDSDIVVGAGGYHNTFRLVAEEHTTKHSIPRKLMNDSAGFVMGNIGLKGSPESLGITNTNVWYLPTNETGNMFPAMEEFYANPFGEVDAPMMITFPSIKENDSPADKVSCQVLILMDYERFEEWKHEVAANRGEDYEAVKEKWRNKILPSLYRFFPKTKGAVELCDISTPLSIEHHLNSTRGGAVGLDITPDRFFNKDVSKFLDPVTRIPKLYLTGHDIVLPGVVMAQIAGVITSFRILGFFQSVLFVLQSVLLLD